MNSKHKTCCDCGAEVEGKKLRCDPCLRKRKIILNDKSKNCMNRKKSTKKQLMSMNGNLPLKRGILADLMANGLY